MTDKRIIIGISAAAVIPIAVALVFILRPSHASVPLIATATIAPSAPAVLQAAPASSANVSQVMPPPKPFRGINWGDALSSRQDMSLDPIQLDTVDVNLDGGGSATIKNTHTKRYTRAGDKLQFGSEPVGDIVYSDFDGKFYEVDIDQINPYNLSTIFSQQYGPANEYKLDTTRHWEWYSDGGQIHIYMTDRPPDDIFPNGLYSCEITDVKLEMELDNLQKTEAAKELSKAKKDF